MHLMKHNVDTKNFKSCFEYLFSYIHIFEKTIFTIVQKITLTLRFLYF